MTGRPVVFGEVLFDRFEDGTEVLGGAPFNVAWNLRALGLDPLFVSCVGDDDAGRRIREAMRGFGMDVSGLQVDAEHPTGVVDVRIVDGEPRFDILAGAAWDHIHLPEAAVETALLYHGSLGLRSPVSARSFDLLLAAADDPAVFFDVNLRPPWWERETLLARMRGATTIKLNQAELEALVPGTDGPAVGARELLERSGASLVVVTRGAEGALGVTRDGPEAPTQSGHAVDVVDTVGAGDAFSSVLILGLLAAWPLATTLDRAREFAEAVVGLRGATTPDADFYSPFRATWSPA